jgi:anaerobic magnesium-protoporphyrin IX monomethyl ester cyclase
LKSDLLEETFQNGKEQRLLLIQAPLGRSESLIYPLGIATLASTITPPWLVRLVDPNLSGLEATQKIVREFQPDVIGVSVRNIDSQLQRDLYYYYLYLKEHLIQLREWAPEAIILLGGSGFSLFPEAILQQNPVVDYGIFLEADSSLMVFLENLDTPKKTPGLFLRENGVIVYSGKAEFPAMVDLQLPRYDLLDPKPYERNQGVGIQTKRGCPMNCAYCTYPHLNGRFFRCRPVQHVLAEIEQLKQYNVSELTFVDGIFNLPKDRAVDILETIQSRNMKITWNGWFTETGFDRKFALLCRDTGCREFSFSPDGYSSKSLAALGKSIRKEDIHRIFKTIKELDGTRVAFNFFWNPPEQSLFSFLTLILFAIKCKIMLGKKAGGIIFGNPRIEPHTPLWQRAIEDGVISRETNLLPDTIQDLRDVFYSHPPTRYLDSFFRVYTELWNFKQRKKADHLNDRDNS